MPNFAQINEDNIVTTVIVIDQEHINSRLFGDPASFVQTSYNTRGGVHYGPDGQPDSGVALRKNYAGIGYTYDPVRDAFIPPKPYDSWLLNEDTCQWEPPMPMPTFDDSWEWDESSQQWTRLSIE